MVKQIRICDKCGKDIAGEYSILRVAVLDTRYKQAYTGQEYECCAECEKKILYEFDGMFPARNKKVEEKPAKKYTKTEKSKKKLDDGKIAALRKAGWSLKQISEEMGCSVQTIANHLHGAANGQSEERQEEHDEDNS